MSAFAITGIGCLTALGTLSETWEGVVKGKTGIALKQPFRDFPPYPMALIGSTPCPYLDLVEKVVFLTLQDAELNPPLPDCAVMLGSSRSSQALWETYYQEKRVDRWFQSLPASGSALVSSLIQSQSACNAPMTACATGIWSIAQGCLLLETGQYDRVLCGSIESPITLLTLASFAKMGALAKTGCYPFDDRREGLVLGEGGALFLIEPLPFALKRKAKIQGIIRGFGLTCDAYHVTSPDPNPQMAIRSIEQCLERSRLTPQDIDYIHAHGTSTPLNDQKEAQILQSLFPHTPVSSTKGSIGHTLGASGAISTALCIKSLQNQQLMPNIGLKQTSFTLNLVRNSYSASLRHTLCFSFGFGGQNAVIACSSPDTLD